MIDSPSIIVEEQNNKHAINDICTPCQHSYSMTIRYQLLNCPLGFLAAKVLSCV